MTYVQTRICPENLDKILWDFVIQPDSLILASRLNLVLVLKEYL